MKHLSSFVLLALGALVACGTSESHLSPLPDASVADTAAPPVDAASPDTSVDPGFRDAGAVDAADASACNVINIGILGNPGANPSSNFQTWLTKAGTTVSRIQTGTTPLTAQDLQPFNVIVLDWLQHDYTAGEAALVKAFVDAGGGLISMTGYNNSPTDFRGNPILATLGVSYVQPLTSGPVTTFVSHPITQGLTSVTFNGGYPIKDLGTSGTTRTAIATLPAGTAAVAIESGKGRALVWGDEWIEFDSEWSQLPEIKQLWVNIFGWVSPQGCPLQPPPN